MFECIIIMMMAITPGICLPQYPGRFHRSIASAPGFHALSFFWRA